MITVVLQTISNVENKTSKSRNKPLNCLRVITEIKAHQGHEMKYLNVHVQTCI